MKSGGAEIVRVYGKWEPSCLVTVNQRNGRHCLDRWDCRLLGKCDWGADGRRKTKSGAIMATRVKDTE